MMLRIWRIFTDTQIIISRLISRLRHMTESADAATLYHDRFRCLLASLRLLLGFKYFIYLIFDTELISYERF